MKFILFILLSNLCFAQSKWEWSILTQPHELSYALKTKKTNIDYFLANNARELHSLVFFGKKKELEILIKNGLFEKVSGSEITKWSFQTYVEAASFLLDKGFPVWKDVESFEKFKNDILKIKNPDAKYLKLQNSINRVQAKLDEYLNLATQPFSVQKLNEFEKNHTGIFNYKNLEGDDLLKLAIRNNNSELVEYLLEHPQYPKRNYLEYLKELAGQKENSKNIAIFEKILKMYEDDFRLQDIKQRQDLFSLMIKEHNSKQIKLFLEQLDQIENYVLLSNLNCGEDSDSLNFLDQQLAQMPEESLYQFFVNESKPQNTIYELVKKNKNSDMLRLLDKYKQRNQDYWSQKLFQVLSKNELNDDDFSLLKIAIQRGANPYKKYPPKNQTAAHLIAKNSKFSKYFEHVLNFPDQREANILDDELRTPLHYACMNGNIMTMHKLMVNYSVNPFLKDTYGKTCEDYLPGHKNEYEDYLSDKFDLKYDNRDLYKEYKKEAK